MVPKSIPIALDLDIIKINCRFLFIMRFLLECSEFIIFCFSGFLSRFYNEKFYLVFVFVGIFLVFEFFGWAREFRQVSLYKEWGVLFE